MSGNKAKQGMNSQDDSAGPCWYDRRSSRRTFLAGAAALSAGALVGSRRAAVAHDADAGGGVHGVEIRGIYLASKDRLAEGRYGTMFKRRPAFAPRDDLLDALARLMGEDQTLPDDQNL